MPFIIALCLSLLWMPTWSAANEPKNNPEIIVTLPPLSGLVALLLPHAQVQCLLPAGADPHHFQPSPKQVELLRQGQLLLRASRDDQGWPLQTHHIKTIDLWSSENHGWLQFKQVRHILPTLAKHLSQQYPQHQQTIQTQLPLALQSVTHLEQAWERALDNIRPYGVFMQHPAWHQLMKNKNIPVWAVLESHQHGHEHGPRHLEKALKTFKAHPKALLLGSNRHSNRSLAWLNQHHNAAQPLIKLDALGACNQPWDVLMFHNLQQLQQNL